MLSDRFEDIRKIAVEKIISIRNKSLRSCDIDKRTNFRRFVVPAINVNAKVYYKITDLSGQNITEPPLIRDMIMSELENFSFELLLFFHPCHNPGVQHYVKLVTEASKSVIGYDNRDGVIQQRSRSRQILNILTVRRKSLTPKRQFLC